MKTISIKKIPTLLILCFLVFSLNTHVSYANETIKLPEAQKDSNDLMKALSERRSNRAFSGAKLSEQEISNILWAAAGVSSKTGKRTVPTAINKQLISVYVALEDGVYEYGAFDNTMKKISDKNLNTKLNAPMHILYAAPKNGDDFHGMQTHFGLMHVGSMYQNVALYCTLAGLNNVVKITGSDYATKELEGLLKDGYVIHMVHGIGKAK